MEPAQEYLYKRGIPNADFVVGKQGVRVLEDYDAVSKALLAKFSPQRLVDSGVMNDKRNLVFYNHRLLLPFFDGDDIVYLSARAFPNEVKPKYLNLAGITIPGLYNVNAAVGADVVFLCEGQTDTLALTGMDLPAVGVAGANNVDIAAVGVLRDKKVILAMDNDKAGRSGLARLYQILPYIAESIFEYKKDAKDILDHVLTPEGREKVGAFYRGVSEGTIEPSSGLEEASERPAPNDVQA